MLSKFQPDSAACAKASCTGLTIKPKLAIVHPIAAHLVPHVLNAHSLAYGPILHAWQACQVCSRNSAFISCSIPGDADSCERCAMQLHGVQRLHMPPGIELKHAVRQGPPADVRMPLIEVLP